jgi:RNA polymerase sigma-70 factor (ECF subfamily)
MNATAICFSNSMPDENAGIAQGLRRRDRELLDRLIAKYQHRLLRYLMQLTGQRNLAEDVFQETWIRVLERGHQYDGLHEFGTWLFAIARNLAISHLRRMPAASLDETVAGGDAGGDADRPSGFDLTIQRERHEQLSAGMQQLAMEYREALELRFLEEMSLEEIATVTGAPLSTVKSRIYRGLSALERSWKGARP